MLLLVLAIVDVPLKAELVDVRPDLGARTIQVSQEAVHQFAAAHSGSGLFGAGQVHEYDFAHYFLIIDSAAQM